MSCVYTRKVEFARLNDETRNTPECREHRVPTSGQLLLTDIPTMGKLFRSISVHVYFKITPRRCFKFQRDVESYTISPKINLTQSVVMR